MKIWVNGIERADIAWRGLPQDILAAIDDEAEQSGSILSELYVDGEMVSREYFCALALGEWDTASFTLMPLMDFLRETLIDAEGYSHKLVNGIEALADRLEHTCAQERARNNIMNAATVLNDLSGNSGLAAIIDGVNWLLGIYERGKNFAPVFLRPDEDVMLQSEILDALKRLLDLQIDLQSQDSQPENNNGTCDREQEFNHAQPDWAENICQQIICCLREELLPRVQMLDYRVSDIAQAAQMPVQ